MFSKAGIRRACRSEGTRLAGLRRIASPSKTIRRWVLVPAWGNLEPMKNPYHTLRAFISHVSALRVWRDTRGQDLIEYALMAGFVAVAAGAIMPGVASSISVIFSKVSSVMTVAASQS
jgi:pilus assembly protein Flp/PilA